MIGEEELRVLSKATNAGGGYTVPTDLDSMISTVRRSRAVTRPGVQAILELRAGARAPACGNPG